MKPSLFPVAALGLALTVVITGGNTWTTAHLGDTTTPVRVLTGLLIAAALAIAALGARPAPKLRLALLLAPLGVLTLLLGLRAFGPWPFVWDGFGNAWYAGFLATSMFAATVGVARGVVWARWVAVTFALAAIGTGGINAVWSLGRHDEWAWMPLLSVFCGALLCLGLFHPSVQAHFSRRHPDQLWTSPDRVVWFARWAAIGNMLAIPMLLVYAIVQPVAPETVTSAFLLAPLLGLGSALVLRRKVLGVLVLGATGVALAAHTIATWRGVIDPAYRHTALYYSAFWLPAALLGIIAAVLVLYRALTNRSATT